MRLVLFTTTFTTLGCLQCDEKSIAFPHPTSVLVTNVSSLLPKEQIRRHFSAHGPILVFEPQIDKSTGEALDIIFVKYGTHAKAARCVDREHGRKLGPINH